MPDFEFEFNQQDRELVLTQDVGTFGGTDYIRLTIYPTEAINNIATLPDTGEQAIFYSSLNEEQFDINISPFGAGLDELRLKPIGGNVNDFQIYKNLGDEDIYIKPNEIFNNFGLPQGNYRIQIDFLNQLKDTQGAGGHYQFIIKQISTSRKEVRLKLIDRKIQNNSFDILNITNELNDGVVEQFLEDGTPNPEYKYKFGYVLNIGTGDHNPIMNYAFDSVTDGRDNQSIILKLYEPLAGNIGNRSMVTIEREVLTTQLQDIFYFSDVPDVYYGDGLVPQPQEDWLNSSDLDIGFQNLNQLIVSSSIGDVESDSLISSSIYNYPNLNTNYNEFENHTFFGSAKKKLQNFKTKVETIQGHYTQISKSLIADGVSINGDSVFLIEKRKKLFNKIREEIKTFSPYERFLYFDGQSESSASAPGLGKDYSKTIPVSRRENYESLNQTDGFNIVYKNSNDGNVRTKVNLFENLYKVQDKPFFNYSGNVYLSFILKGTDNLEIVREIDNNKVNSIIKNGFLLPHDTAYTGSTIQPSVTSSEYRRFIFEASQSHFLPNTIDTGGTNDTADLSVLDFGIGSTKIEILNDGIKTGSNQMRDSLNIYPTTVVSSSAGIPFFGSIVSAGDLFNIKFTSGSVLTQSFITDVRVSLKNPTNVLPFDKVYKTTSNEWTNWYNGMLTRAENFDIDNIHSFENNLPEYIRESSDYQDMKDFLNLQGEQYDLIRNHIDSLGTLHNRGYKETNSPPNNVLPMLLSNMGWQAINPFSGSLSDSLGNYLSGVTSIDDIKNQTWRKTLNNLLYIYKSKGTKNSVRALLNVYGYPPDVLQIQEFGGNNENQLGDGNLIDNSIPVENTTEDSVVLDINTENNIVGFVSNKRKLHRYIFNGRQDRVLNLDWWMDDANLNTIEFVYKHVESNNTQTILKSSGSGVENLWDLRLIPSSDGLSSSFEFRLNNSQVADTDIGSRGFSMSLAYNKMTDGQLWNVMLQRMTGSSAGAGTIEYKLHSALQKNTSIDTYTHTSMEVSGGLVGDSSLGGKGFFANQNFQSSGSRHYQSSSNLVVGETLSGSLAEIRGWSTALSASKFKQHILNKFSTVGNVLRSHCDELVYHFKLNENYSLTSISSSTQNLQIVDSSGLTHHSNYSFDVSGSLFSGSNAGTVYGFDIIDVVQLGLQDNNQGGENDNTILINPNSSVVGNLNPNKSIIKSFTNQTGKKPRFQTSKKLELYRSPQTFINNFILDKLSGFNLETLYGNPLNHYSQSYNELDTFRNEFFDCYTISSNVNEFIRAHENMFNDSITEGLKTLVPARSTFSDKNSNMGVEIKPTVLEKQKYENEAHSVEVNPNTGLGSIDITSITSLVSSQYQDINIDVKEGTILGAPTPTGSKLEQAKTGSITITPLTTGTELVLPKTGSISPSPSLNESSVPTSKDGTYDYASIANKSYSDLNSGWGIGSDDTHFINFAGGLNSRGDFNTYHIDSRFIFNAIGDNEYYSASINNSSNFTDSKRFYNRKFVTGTANGVSSDVQYEDKNFGTGLVTGRMMGKTRYFTTGSDGNITLPSNHVTKFSNPFKDRMYLGAQNIKPGKLNVQYEDYSVDSFYKVTVTGGENNIRINSGNPSKGDDDKIIYDKGGG